MRAREHKCGEKNIEVKWKEDRGRVLRVMEQGCGRMTGEVKKQEGDRNSVEGK